MPLEDLLGYIVYINGGQKNKAFDYLKRFDKSQDQQIRSLRLKHTHDTRIVTIVHKNNK
jgi:hypothetical protein